MPRNPSTTGYCDLASGYRSNPIAFGRLCSGIGGTIQSRTPNKIQTATLSQ